jgi:hypothetical protein
LERGVNTRYKNTLLPSADRLRYQKFSVENPAILGRLFLILDLGI